MLGSPVYFRSPALHARVYTESLVVGAPELVGYSKRSSNQGKAPMSRETVERGPPALPERVFGPLTSRLETVAASAYSCEHAHDIEQLDKIVFADGDVKVVHDACAHIGGFALPLAVRHPDVAFACTEVDERTYEVLLRNIALVAPGNVSAARASAAAAHCPEASVVYYDPPWGGRGYRDAAEMSLLLDGVNVADLIARRRGVRHVLKAPLNYRRSDLERALAGAAAVRWTEVRAPGGRARFLVADVRPVSEK